MYQNYLATTSNSFLANQDYYLTLFKYKIYILFPLTG